MLFAFICYIVIILFFYMSLFLHMASLYPRKKKKQEYLHDNYSVGHTRVIPAYPYHYYIQFSLYFVPTKSDVKAEDSGDLCRSFYCLLAALGSHVLG